MYRVREISADKCHRLQLITPERVLWFGAGRRCGDTRATLMSLIETSRRKDFNDNCQSICTRPSPLDEIGNRAASTAGLA